MSNGKDQSQFTGKSIASSKIFRDKIKKITIFEVIVNPLPLAITIYLPLPFQLLPARLSLTIVVWRETD